MANLICTYNITATTSNTNLCNNRTGFTAMYVDGVETPLSTGYTFNTLGGHTVEFVLKDNTIGEKAFMNNFYNLVSVIIPEGVETIETYAFGSCRALTSITLPSTLKHIGDFALSNCESLTSINLPEGLLTIGDSAFMGCVSLTTLELPSTLTSIRFSPFNGTSITELTIPDSVISLSEQGFGGCKYLKTVTIPDIESGYEINFNNCSSVENVYLGKGLRVIQDECFGNCTSLKSLVIPEGVTSIGIRAFQSCKSLETIHIPEGVTSIGGNAFLSCQSLTSINLPEGLLTIGNAAFRRCYSLKTVALPSTLTTISSSAFEDTTSLTQIISKATIQPSIEFGTFENTKTGGTLFYPKGSDYSQWLSTDGYYLGYYGWNGVEFDIDNPPKLDEKKVVVTYNITDTTSPTTIIYRKDNVLYCYIDGVYQETPYSYQFDTIGEHIVEYVLNDETLIAERIFYNCKTLNSIELPDSITKIDSMAFMFCSGLTSITIPENVTSMGEEVFYSCSGLTSITTKAETAPQVIYNTFQNVPQGGTLYYPYTSDYSTWLSKNSNYLGYYKWNGIKTYPEGSTPSISITPSSFNFDIDVTGSNYIIDVEYYGNLSIHQDSVDWCYIWTKDEYKGTRYFLNCSDNNGGAPRKHSIEFRATIEDRSESVYLTISQNGVEPDVPPVPDAPSINLEYDKLTAPQGGITSTLDVETNGVDDIVIIAPEWVEVTNKGGYYEIEVLPNDEGYRGGEVIFIGNQNKPNKVQQNILINQFGNEGDMATSIAFYKTRLDYPSSGGTGYVKVDYVNPQTINEPYCSQRWVTIERIASTNTIQNGQTVVQIEYGITMAETSFARQINVKFSCTDSNGNEVSQNKFMLYQAAPVGNMPKVEIDKSSITFDSKGYAENFGIKVTYTNSTTIYQPIVNGDWITVTEGAPIQGGNTGNSDVVVKRYLVEVTETNAYRQGTIVFKAGNSYGSVNSPLVSIIQNAPVEDEEIIPVISAYTKTATVKYDGSSTGIAITSLGCSYTNVSTVLTPVVSADWIHLGEGVLQSSLLGDTYVYRYPITFDTNDSVERIGYVTFKGTDEEGNTYSDKTTIKQLAAPSEPDEPTTPDIPVDGEEYCGPIWKDVEYDFGTMDQADYSIYMVGKVRLPGNGGTVNVDNLIYKGRSCRRPSDNSNTILVNKICQNYLNAPLLEKDVFTNSNGYAIFKLKSGDGNVEYKTYRFVNDWSYGEFATGVLSHPILNDSSKVAKNQLLPFTVFAAAEEVAVQYGIFYKDGSSWDTTLYKTNGVETEMFPYSGRTEGAVGYYIGNKSYDIVEQCCVEYVLYYVNPWGGYDWFPIRGKVEEKDSLTAYGFTQNYNNQTWEFGKRRYLTEITKKYTLHTQWLSEDESSRMWYLLQSNVVYLHNVKKNEIYPVIITNTEQEHKKKIRGTRISYAIEVELSQYRERI